MTKLVGRVAALTLAAVFVSTSPPSHGQHESVVSAGISKIAMPGRGICAHRGASATHPENTLAAFQEAIRLGVHQIEFDVALTKDARLILMHDATVDRTTDGHGKVSDLTLAQIKRLDAGSWKQAHFADQRVPTLDEAISIMPRNVWLNVHLKGGAELGAAVAREIVEQGRQHQAFLACSKPAAEAARRIAPELLICNMERQDNSTRYVDDTIARKCHFIQLLRSMASPEDMAKLKEAGTRVNYCCTDDPESLASLYAAGVQFPLVDDVEAMMKAAQKLGIGPLQPVLLPQTKRD